MMIALASTSETVTIRSAVLGDLVVSPERIIEFEDGLVGRSDLRSFVVLESPEEGLYWMQSADHETLVFLLADPFRHCPGYEVHLRPSDLRDLAIDAEHDVLLLSMVTLPKRPGAMATINLQGPIAINVSGGLAKQVVIGSSEFGVRHTVQLTSGQL